MDSKEDIELNLALFGILQKVFLLGYLAGQKQLEDDYNASASPIGQVLADLQNKIESIVPGSTMAGNYNSLMAGLEKAESLAKAENHKKQRLAAQHDRIVQELLTDLKNESEKLKLNTVKELEQYKDQK